MNSIVHGHAFREDDLRISRHTAVHWFTAQHAFEHDNVFICGSLFVLQMNFIFLADLF